uniref:Uncharacterized protein n=2 Tax=Oryza sativa subsp. japonica TaxID=39947 RepID=Q53N67_ORYSJ|nr:hypothetical protein LOC_Os11g17050 [Oryza sativa Japonica Group]ABA92664.1 hypothetical protein LOC_Os11g17049 [Oryza sativa Japonica Group]
MATRETNRNSVRGLLENRCGSRRTGGGGDKQASEAMDRILARIN